MSEDRQPNENRIGRKGYGAPPSVRSSAAPLRGRGAAAHYGQHRTSPHAQGGHAPAQGNRGSFRARGGRGARPDTIKRFRSTSPRDAVQTPTRSNAPSLPDKTSASTSQTSRYTFPDPIVASSSSAPTQTPGQSAPRYPAKNRTWVSSNYLASKRQRLAPNEESSLTEPSVSSSPVASSSTPGPSSIPQPSQRMPPLPSGQIEQTVVLPSGAHKGVIGNKEARKAWLAEKEKELASRGERIAMFRWYDETVILRVMPAKPLAEDSSSTSVGAPNVDVSMDVDTEQLSPTERAERRAGKRRRDENDDPQGHRLSPAARPHVYAFTSGTLTLSKPLAQQSASSPAHIDSPSTTRLVQVNTQNLPDSLPTTPIPATSASHNPALLRTDISAPVITASRSATLSTPSEPLVPTSESAQSQTTLYVGNLNFDIDDAGLGALFREAGIEVISACVARRRLEPYRSRGYGFVDVGGEEEQKKAIAILDGKKVAGRAIYLRISVSTRESEKEVKSDAAQMQQSTQATSVALSNSRLASSSQTLRGSPVAPSSAPRPAQASTRTLPDSLPIPPIPSAPHKQASLRANMPAPALPASRIITPSTPSTPLASTSKPAHPIRPSSVAPSMSNSRTGSYVKSAPSTPPVASSRPAPASRSAQSTSSRPAQPPTSAPSSSALSHMPSPALSTRSLESSTSDSSSSSLPGVISAPPVRPAPRPKPKANSPPPPANAVIVISSDDARGSSSSESEEDQLDPSDGERASTQRTPNVSRPSFSPSPSPEPDDGNYPTDEFELTIKGTASLPNNDSRSRDKPRLILVDRPGKSIFTVMYHGFVDRFGRASRRRTNVYIPNVPSKQYIENACLLDLRDSAHILMAHSSRADGRELTLVSRSGKVSHFKRRLRPNEKSGAAAVCALPAPNRFAASGSDHVVYQWTVSSAAPLNSAILDEDSDEDDVERGFSAHARPLQIKHTSAIRALLPLSNTLLASGSADCSVHIFDMGAQTVAHTLKPSNAVTNLHSLAATHRHGILLEVAHKDLQFEIRDVRVGRDQSLTRFGWLAGRTSGNYVRGSVRGDVFACGDRDGVVRVWDLRNTQDPIETKQVFSSAGSMAKIVHVAFDGGKLYAMCEGNELAFLNTT